MKRIALIASHLVVLAIGFALGVYTLPILVAPEGPSPAEARAEAQAARYSGQFRRDLKGSDALHWGEGVVSVGKDRIVLVGEIAPGPDYKLYLAPDFVETEADFARLKPGMARVGDVKTFKNFVVPVSDGIDVERYSTVIVWCETFSQFITAARYK